MPVALTRLGAPALDGHRSLSVRELYAASPVGVVGAGVAGLLVGSFYALGVVIARKIGLSVSEASLFMSMVVLGGFSFQWPIGMLADRHDRRLVLSGVLVAAGISWPLLAGLTASGLPLLGLLMLALLFGGAISSVYPICVAQTFDRLERKHYVAAAGRLLLFYAVGATAGPLLTSTIMAALGPYSFFALKPSWQSPSPASSFIASTSVRRCPSTNRKLRGGAERDADCYGPRPSHRRGHGRIGGGRKPA